MTIYFCCDDRRRNAVRAHATLNGIDFLEVQDDPTQPLADRQRFLTLTLLKPPASPLTRENFRIEGGESVRGIRALNVTAAGAVLTVEVDRPGDYSVYTLRLAQSASADEPPAGFDPILAAVDFSFKVNCETDFDCGAGEPCPPEEFVEPQLNYLARDFNSIRQVMIDRMRAINPKWQEDHLADLMQALIDLKAYTADYQHYQLDATTTEAYLFTARSRVSARRHARLVDYAMHDGLAARAWVQVTVDPDVPDRVTLPRSTQILTRVPGRPPRIAPESEDYRAALEANPVVFETLHDADLWSAHNVMCFYTWSDERCVLPRGATRATLDGWFPNLEAGMVLIFEETRGAETGDPDDANPANRFAVRLAWRARAVDPLTGAELTEIGWRAEDALPAPLCLSADVPEAEEELPCPRAVSVARGNIILADHGRTLPVEPLGVVPASTLVYARSGADRCDGDEPESIPPRFRPRLSKPVAHCAPYQHNLALQRPAAAALRQDPAAALPALLLANAEDFTGPLWRPRRDLLASAPDKTEYVLETEADGTARIRFGDDQNGKRPNPGEPFYARYRSGGGLAGNVGAGALAHIVTLQTAILSASNRVAAGGGLDPETIEEVRQNAPHAFRVQERAVTPADYEAVALRFPGVQRAVATLRWTGAWYTVFLTVDRVGGLPVDPAFETAFRRHVDAFRMMGYDLEIDSPLYAPIEVEIEVCVEPGAFRAAVRDELLAALSSRALPDGRKGLFHPENFTFGQPVFLSRIYAAALAIPGVQSAAVTKFQVQDRPATSGLESGRIELGRLQIAQLENNPNFPQRGLLRLTVSGGK